MYRPGPGPDTFDLPTVTELLGSTEAFRPVLAQGSPMPTDGTGSQAVVAVVSLVLVVVGAELFATGAEWVGDRLGFGQSATGEVFAALATTVPETLIPVLAILQGQGASIGVGSILGGPLTLTTLAAFLLGASAWAYAARGTREPSIAVDRRQVTRDLRVFLVGFSLAFVAALVGPDAAPLLVGSALVGLYVWYLYRVLQRSEAGGDTEPEPLEFGKLLSRFGGVLPRVDPNREHEDDPSTRLLAAQVLVAVGTLLVGSHLLVGAIERASETVLPIPTILVALLVAPVVSNLPENLEGVIWMGRGKDDLAVEQVTGTLAFQGTVVVAIGVAFTPWRLSPATGAADLLVGLSVLLALVGGGAMYLRFATAGDGSVRPGLFVGLGLLYLGFVAAVAYYVLAGHL